MALRATVYKADLSIADIDRGYYADHALTLALHPSETEERLMLRLLAFALYASEGLAFGRGLSAEDEPDLIRRDDTGAITLWIEVGLPDEKWVRKACGRADQVVVLTYGGHRAELWWRQHGPLLARNAGLTVLDIDTEASRALAAQAARAMRWTCTLQEGQLWLTNDAGASVAITPSVRQGSRDQAL